MIYICLFVLCAAIILAALFIRKYSKLYKRIISFRDSMDLTGLPVITFHQGKTKLNFLLDTGAERSVINQATLENIKHNIIEGSVSEVYGIEGNAQTTFSTTISFTRDLKYCEEFQVVDLSAAFNDIKAETGVTISGILGNDFFQKYQYVLDYSSMIAYPKA